MVTNLAVGDDFVIDQGSARLTVPEGSRWRQLPAPSLRPSISPPSQRARVGRLIGSFAVTRRASTRSRPPTWACSSPLARRSRSMRSQPSPSTSGADPRSSSQSMPTTVPTPEYPYHVTVGITNVADVPMYNVSLELLKDGRKNYIYQPREQLAIFDDTIEPGETFSHDYILVPEISGTWTSPNPLSATRPDSSSVATRSLRTPRSIRRPRRQNCVPTSTTAPWRSGGTTSPAHRTSRSSSPRTPTRTSRRPRCRHSSWDRTPPLSTTSPTTPTGLYALSPIIGGRPYLRHPLTHSRRRSHLPGDRDLVEDLYAFHLPGTLLNRHSFIHRVWTRCSRLSDYVIVDDLTGSTSKPARLRTAGSRTIPVDRRGTNP